MKEKSIMLRMMVATIFLVARVFAASAQSGSEKTITDHANILFDQREFEQAFDYYMKLKDLHPDNILFQYRAGVCAIYRGDPEEALTLIKSSYDKDPTIPMINFYLGRAYLLNGQYDDALLQFNLQLAKETDDNEKIRLTQYIINCTSAKDISQKPTPYVVTNAGRQINSPGDEFAPIFFKNDSGLIFTYKGSQSTGGKSYIFGSNDSAGFYYEDVFESVLTSTGWFVAQGISQNVNTPAHDAATAISPDGKYLFIFRNADDNGGDIYMSRKAGSDWTVPVSVPGINSPSWEGSVTISADSKTMYFSSDRPGGFGGKDIYSATLLGDSTWGNVQNLGAAINSPLDDDAPYIYPDGKKLVFCSRGHNSMGGYDIFYSELSADGVTWADPQNMGVPVNSTSDDIYYYPTKDGNRAAFSSNRPGGNGMMDIYFVSPGTPTNALLGVKGTVTLDDQPTDATITVTGDDTSKVFGDYTASAKDGSYSINLPGGQHFRFVFMSSGQTDQLRTYDATTLTTFTTQQMDVQFYTDEYRMKHPDKFGNMNKNDSAKTVTNLHRREIMDTALDIISISDSAKYYKIMDAGLTTAPGYYIVVGSFTNKDFAKRMEAKLNAQGKYPKVQRVLNTQSGFTYVSVGNPATKDDAIQLAKLARKDFPDAWVETLK